MWCHEKHNGRRFKGCYETDKDGERVFVLMQNIAPLKEKLKKYTFESWQMAKKLGWIKVK